MGRHRKRILIAGGVVVAMLAGAAFVLHSPTFMRATRGLHGGGIHSSGPAAELIGDFGGSVAANQRALDGVAALGTQWDEQVFAETVRLYAEVHREIEWPGVLAPEVVSYGRDPDQRFDLYRPEQPFSEPGPVFLFLHGNGLGDIQRVAAGSDGLIYSHLGKIGAFAGGIGISMGYRGPADGDTFLQSGAADLRAVIEWIVEHISAYGGDPDTIVIVANAEGATVTAAYLFNAAWQPPSGHGVAAVFLASGHFGSLNPQIEKLVEDYDGSPVPLALWSSEYDPDDVVAGTVALNKQLCAKYGACPDFRRFDGHNHVSHIMSLGTADTASMNALIGFYHTVR